MTTPMELDYWSNMTYGRNLLVGTKWTGATYDAAHPEYTGCHGPESAWTEYVPSTLITTC